MKSIIQIKQYKASSLLVLLLMLPFLMFSQVNLIQNGSFESNPLTNPPTTAPAYLSNSFGVNPTLNNWTIVTQTIDLHHAFHWNMLSPDGTYHIDLNNTGCISQSNLQLQGGKTYSLSYWTSVHALLNTGQNATAIVEIKDAVGNTVFSNAINKTKLNGAQIVDVWVNQNVNFTPNINGNYSIYFTALNSDLGPTGGVLLDNINISIVLPAPPNCDDICDWNLNGNEIHTYQDGKHNKFGTLSNDDINIISNNLNRGIITNDGRLGWNQMNPLTTFHVGAGQARFDNLSGVGNSLLEVDNLGTLQRKTSGTSSQFLNGSGNWTDISTIGHWSKNAINNAYLTPTGNNYVGINNPNPQANLDILNTQCDNKPAIRVLNNEGLSALCNSPNFHGNFMEFYVSNNFTILKPRFIVTNHGFVGINRFPSYSLDVAGSLRVNTTFYSSDKKYKKNIETIKDPIQIIQSLNGKTYTFKTKEFPDNNFEECNQYGFIAQEIQKVLPELVKEDKEGYLAVNYISIIPILTQAIKEQQTQIDDLKSQIANNSESKYSTETGKNEGNSISQQITLSQNIPNPFTTDTRISYSIPQQYKVAKLGIYDLNGQELKLENLTSASGEIVIQGRSLKPGMYIYCLIVDGQNVASKKMTLTSN